jgi:hypothetical protein
VELDFSMAKVEPQRDMRKEGERRFLGYTRVTISYDSDTIMITTSDDHFIYVHELHDS